MKKTLSNDKVFHGAGDEARTRYLHLGKVALYRMSYARILAFLRTQVLLYHRNSTCQVLFSDF